MPTTATTDQTFLEQVSDHHEGMIQMSQEAERRAQSADARKNAKESHDKQQHELKELLAMLQRDFGEQYTPKVMPSNQKMMQQLEQADDGQFDQTFFQLTIQHHREGIEMMQRMLPQLTIPELRQRAEQMVQEQQSSIRDLEQKLGRR